MKKVLVLVVFLSVNLLLRGQAFIDQRIEFVTSYEESLRTKVFNKYYTELRVINENNVYLIDSSVFLLIDANYVNDSIELFYQTSLNKVVVKKVLSPIPIPKRYKQDFSYKYLRINDVSSEGWELSDTFISSSYAQELVKVYDFYGVQITVNIGGYMRALKDSRVKWDVPHFRSSMLDVVMDFDKKDIIDYQDGKILYNYVEKGGTFGKPKTHLLEIDLNSGKVTFKSPFNQNVSAFYLENGNIVFVAKTDGIVNRLYVFDKKKKKVISDYFGFITNAICL
jgi:hypothetical protein